MNVTVSGQPPKRVREEVKDGLSVMVFSAAASCALAVTLMLVVALAN